MTENEAIEELEHSVVSYEVQNKNNITCDLTQNVLDMAIQALKEIQQYRAIGTVEELKTMKENGAFTGVELAQLAAMQMRLKEYSAIGTIEEIKALKKKSVPRKIKGTRFEEAICPRCESELFETYWAFGGIHYCSNCGQTIDWQ